MGLLKLMNKKVIRIELLRLRRTTNGLPAIKELIKGTMDYFQLFAIFGSTAVIAGGLIYFCVFWFNREKVLFR